MTDGEFRVAMAERFASLAEVAWAAADGAADDDRRLDIIELAVSAAGYARRLCPVMFMTIGELREEVRRLKADLDGGD